MTEMRTLIMGPEEQDSVPIYQCPECWKFAIKENLVWEIPPKQEGSIQDRIGKIKSCKWCDEAS